MWSLLKNICWVAVLWGFTYTASATGFGLADDEVLPVDEAFMFNAEVKDNTIQAIWVIADGHYLYNNKFKFAIDNQNIKIGDYIVPKGEIKQDEYFGEMEISHQQVVVNLPLVVKDKSASSFNLTVDYQGCSEQGICYPPTTRTVALTLSGATATPPPTIINTDNAQTTVATVADKSNNLSEQDKIAQTLANSNFFWIVVVFFGFGLALSLTPCVFPMIPILSGIIVGQGANLSTKKAFLLSLVYVIAMAITYSIAGVLAAVFGANLQAALQNIWVISAFSVVFVLLSLSMFGFYEMQMPASLQNRLTQVSNNQQSGTLIGVAIMGFLSALIVGPCVAAPLAGALIYIGQTGDAVLGFVSLFALSIGMGVPLIIIGTSAGKLLPRAGGWMNVTKAVFGILLLAVAIWMLERVLPAQVTLLLWAALLIVPAIYLHALDPLNPDSTGWQKFWKGIGVLMLLYGALLVVGVSAGGDSLLQPLSALKVSQSVTSNETKSEFAFIRVKSIADVEQQIKQANQQGKTVMLDFYADWCVSCKELEHLTFSDATVQRTLAKMVLIQANVTANDAVDKALLKHFSLIGPPSLLFFDKQGQQQKAYQLVGFKPADEFNAHVKKFLAE